MRSSPTFDEFFTYIYLPHAKARKRSWQLDDRLATRHLSPYFGSKQLKKIRAREVEDWLTNLHLKGLKASSCNRILALLKSVMALAITLGYIRAAHSPCREIRQLKTEAHQERFLSREEGVRLMSWLRRQPGQEAIILQLLLLTGARKSEILKARWENLDCDQKILIVPKSKSGRVRYIHLSDEAIKLLDRMKANRRGEWIFPGRDPARPLTDIYVFWNRTRKKLGLDGVRIHDLRHSFASFLVAQGQSLYITQQLLGHVDPRTTMRYAHFANETLKKAVASLPELLAINRSGGKMTEAREKIGQLCGTIDGICQTIRVAQHEAKLFADMTIILLTKN